MKRTRLTPPTCCGIRTTGNERDGYRATPVRDTHVRIRPTMNGQWLVEIRVDLMRADVTNGPQSAANAATRCLRKFAGELMGQIGRKA
jgi:hypothetical protein